MLDSKTESLLKKLKALAERGIGGEKLNAQAMLNKLLKKHGLEEMDLEEEHKDWHPVFVPVESERLFFQVASTVLGKDIFVDNSDEEDYLFIECTTSEAIEIEAKYNFYWRAFCEETEVLLDAFIRKNELAAKEDYSFVDVSTLSEQERERIQREMDMANSVKEVKFAPPDKYKALNK